MIGQSSFQICNRAETQFQYPTVDNKYVLNLQQSRNSVSVPISNNSSDGYQTVFQLQPSFSIEAMEMLIGTGFDRVQVTNLLTGAEPLGQRPMIQDHRMDQRSCLRVTEDQGIPQLAQSGSSSTVLETLVSSGRKVCCMHMHISYGL